MGTNKCDKCGKELKFAEHSGKVIPLLCSCRMQELENERKKEIQAGEKLLKAELNKKTGVSIKYSAILLKDIKPQKGQESAFAKINEFYNAYVAENGEKVTGIAIFGGVGSGKTMLTSALTNQLSADALSKVTEEEKRSAFYRNYSIKTPALFTNTVEMLEKIKKSYEENDSFIDRVKNCPLLILDDFGAARVTEWVEEKIYEIIDYRYSNLKPVIITSNSLPNELAAAFDKRITDRLKEMCTQIYIDSASLRPSASAI